jgi:hypothetical protein
MDADCVPDGLIGQRWGQSIGGELRGRMIDELRKRGHNI